MRHFIGTIRNAGQNDQYIFLEYVEHDICRVMSIDKYHVPDFIRGRKIKNIELVGGKAKVIGGIDNYLIRNEYGYLNNVLIVVQKVIGETGEVGYVVYNGERGIAFMKEDEALRYLEENGGAANARVVPGKYIAPLKGEFDTYNRADLSRIMEKEKVRIQRGDFLRFLESKGVGIEIDGVRVFLRVPETGLKLPYLKIPEAASDVYEFIGGPLRIGSLTIYGYEDVVEFSSKTAINNLIFDNAHLKVKEVNSLILRGNVLVDKAYNTPDVERLSRIRLEFNGYINTLTLEGESLEVSEFLTHKRGETPLEIKHIDLSGLGKKSLISKSFGGLRGEVKVTLGGTTTYIGEVFQETNVRLQNSFPDTIRKVNGFNSLVGVEKLDFSKCRELSELKFISSKDLVEVRLPESCSDLKIEYGFNGSNVRRLVLVGSYQLSIGKSFSGLEELVFRRNNSRVNYVGSREFEKLRVVVEPMYDTLRLPFISGQRHEIYVGEGVKNLSLCALDSNLERIHLPKTLMEIKTSCYKEVSGKETLPTMNLEDTQVTVLEKYIFRGVQYNGTVYEIPKTIRVVEDGALDFVSSTKYFIPESVESIKSTSLNPDVVYLKKGSRADKCIKNVGVKIYVNSMDDVINRMSEAERAKLELVKGNKEEYKIWAEDTKFSKNLPELIRMDQEANNPMNPYKLGTKLNRAKFVDLGVSELGGLSESIEKAVKNSVKFYGGRVLEGTSDQFNMLSNMITNKCRHYIRPFKLVPILGSAAKEIVARGVQVWYCDGDSYIASLKLWVTGLNDVEYVARGIVIVEHGRLRFATVVHNNNYFSKFNMNGPMFNSNIVVGNDKFLSGIMHRVTLGDNFDSIEGRFNTVGLMNLPVKLRHKVEVWRMTDELLLDFEYGRLIQTKRVGVTSNTIVGIKEFGEYRLDDLVPDEVFKNEEIIRMYEILRGERFKMPDIRAKKLHVVEELERHINGEITYEELQRFIIKHCKVVGEKTSVDVRRFKNVGTRIAEAGEEAWRSGISKDKVRTFYVPIEKLERLKGSTVRDAGTNYSAELLLENSKELLSEKETTIRVGDRINDAKLSGVMKLATIRNTQIWVAVVDGDRRVFLMAGLNVLGIVEDSLELIKYLQETKDEVAGYGEIDGTLKLLGGVDKRIEARLGIAEKIYSGKELTRDEEGLAAIMAYGYGGIFKLIGFREG